MKIRNWTNDDIVSVAVIEKNCFSKPWTLAMLEEEINNPYFFCLVVETDNIVIAYLNYHIINGQYHIANIAVESNYRRKGIAKGLLKELLRSAKENNISGITLEVNSNNAAAENLYKKMGFKTMGIRKKYYGGTEDALIMWLYL